MRTPLPLASGAAVIGGYAGPLYDAGATVGDAARIASVAVDMRSNGVVSAAMFFTVDASGKGAAPRGADYAFRMLRHSPASVVPFFRLKAPKQGTAPEARLLSDYRATFARAETYFGKGVLQGIGDLSLADWGRSGVSASDPLVAAIASVAAEHNLLVKLHPRTGDVAQIEALMRRFPALVFLIHQSPREFDQDREAWGRLMDQTKNFLFAIDANDMMDDGTTGLLSKYRGTSPAEAAAAALIDYRGRSDRLLTSALARFKDAIESHPDRFAWGSGAEAGYPFSPAVYDAVAEFSRRFIARLRPDARQRFAYDNAAHYLGHGLFCGA